MRAPSKCSFIGRYLCLLGTMVISGDLVTSVVDLDKAICSVKGSAIPTNTLLGGNISLLWVGLGLQTSVAGVCSST